MSQRREYTDFERGTVYGLHLAGKSEREIHALTKIPKSSVHDILQNPQPDKNARTGRPKKLSKRSERLILRTVKLSPKISYTKLKKRCQLDVSDDTIRRLLHDHNIKKWLAKKRPKLTNEYAKKRFEWAVAYKDWT
jgi:hypothetical protein